MVLTTADSSDLIEGLLAHNYTVDRATSIDETRELFLERGGHTMLVISAEVSSNLAQQAIDTLREIDESIPVVVFGELTLRDSATRNLHRIPSFHPSSRAGIGAIQKVLCR